uniref:Uncharacterized protein n=1 Tax=Dulem virus 33 TaxID=3145751 RepID=A0AAU8B5N6_9CAUD
MSPNSTAQRAFCWGWLDSNTTHWSQSIPLFGVQLVQNHPIGSNYLKRNKGDR